MGVIDRFLGVSQGVGALGSAATGMAEVFTLELTELGFSMLTWPEGPPLVFSALLASCFEDTGTSQHESRRLTDGKARLVADTGGYGSQPADGMQKKDNAAAATSRAAAGCSKRKRTRKRV